MESTLRHVNELIRRCCQLRTSGAKEDVLRAEFASHLRRVFPDTDNQRWINHYTQGAEATERLRRRGEATPRLRFVDTLVNATALEYEADLRPTAVREHAKAQLRDATAAMIQRGVPASQIRAIVSDCVLWEACDIVSRHTGTVETTRPEDIELVTNAEIDLEDSDASTPIRFLNFLKAHLARRGGRELRAINLALDFGLDSHAFAEHASRVLAVVVGARQSDSAVQLATDLWARFVDHLETGRRGFRGPNYAAQLYLVVFARLLAANVLTKSSLNSADSELRSVLSGDYFAREFKLTNFAERDYFGWAIDSPHLDNLLPIARLMQADLAAYDYGVHPCEDVFAPLVGQLAAKTQRRLLGQEQTPTWLARRLAQRALDLLPKVAFPRFVDMCCGSGVIVCEFLRELQTRNSKVTVEELASSVTGFDIDPLAVTLAKTNWVITLADRIAGTRDNLAIPIFHADSLFAASPTAKGLPIPEKDCDVPVSLDGSEILMPRVLLEPQCRPVFDEFVDWAYDNALKAQRTRGVGHITSILASQIVETSCKIHGVTLETGVARRAASSVYELAVRMGTLAIQGRNGIWAFILKNTYRPSLLAGSFNGIISNPPWLALSKIANNPYKDRISTRTTAYGLYPPGSAFLHLEIATTFLLYAVDRYLCSDGVVAVILPGTIQNGVHHQPLRDRGYLSTDRPVPVAFHEIWEVAKETFKVRAAVLCGQKNVRAAAVAAPTMTAFFVSPTAQTPLTFHTEVLGHGRTAWVLGSSPTTHVSAGDVSIPPQGADLMPRTAVCVDVIDRRGKEWKIATPERSSTSHYAIAGAKQMVNARFTGWVAPAFAHTMLQSLGLLPFWFDPNGPTVVIPARRNEDGEIEVVDDDVLRAEGFRNTAKHFDNVDVAMKRARIKQTLRKKIDTRNKLREQSFPLDGSLILVGAGGSDPCAATFDLSEAESPIVDQTLYWRWCKQRDEAAYYVGMFNSRALADKIKNFNPQGLFGPRHVHTLPWRVTPAFDSQEAKHRELARLSLELRSEMKDASGSDPKLCDLAIALHARRKRAWGVVHASAKFAKLNAIAADIL